MKITFVSLTEDVLIHSLRYLSAYLKAQGHTTTLVLLPWNYTDKTLNAANSFLYPYPDSVLEQVAEKCKTADLVGISLMTCHFDNAVHVTKFLRRRLSVPIIWGGVHPTIRPEECLEYADMVCVGEGEIGMKLLAEEMAGGKSWQSVTVPGILKRSHGEPLSIVPGPLLEDLNEMPLPDYDLEHQFVLSEGNLVRLDGRLLARWLGCNYITMFSRGCPYACTYCCNNAFRSLYQRKLPLRWRTVDNRIRELKAAIELMPELRVINFCDDAFLAQPPDILNDFAAKYREQIHMPFSLITTPRSVTEPKISVLAAAGLYHIGIGIQSGSPRIYKKLYSRPESLDDIISASRCIKQVARKQNKQILGRYDFILDNPWETEEDIEASIRLCTKLERPYNLAMFSLTLYPGTELYRKARNEGLITDDLNQVYRSSQLVPKRTYLNGVFATVSANAPKWVISLLLWKPLRRWSPLSFPYLVASGFEFIKLARGFLGFAIRGEWTIIRFLFKQGWAKFYDLFSPAKLDSNKPRFSGAPGQISG